MRPDASLEKDGDDIKGNKIRKMFECNFIYFPLTINLWGARPIFAERDTRALCYKVIYSNATLWLFKLTGSLPELL